MAVKSKEIAGSTAGVDEDEFVMWRAVFAMAHADHQVTREEEKFMNRLLADVSFTPEQQQILRDDIYNPQDVADLFVQIKVQKNRSRFFYFARLLLWCDGDFDRQEQEILTTLGQSQYRGVDFDQMVKDANLGLALEEEERQWLLDDSKGRDPEGSGSLLDRFKGRFFS